MTFGRARAAGLAAWLLILFVALVRGQDLAPRAYVVSPVGSNALTLAYSYNDGTLRFGGTVPITDARCRSTAISGAAVARA